MKTTIPKLRRMIRKVITESMADTVRDLQGIMDIERGPVGNRAMDNLYKREQEAEEYRKRQHAEKYAQEAAEAEKYFVQLTLPNQHSQHYPEWKSWVDSLDLTGAEFRGKRYHDRKKEKPFYLYFKIDKQKALEIEAEGETLPETEYSSVKWSVRKPY